MATISEETQFNLTLNDDNMIYFNKLDLKQNLFDDELKSYTSGEEIYYKLTEDVLQISHGEGRQLFLTAKWNFIGCYGSTDEGYYWTWPWLEIPGKDYNLLKEVLKKLSPELIPLAQNHITFTDPMIISYLQAFLAEEYPFDYIKIIPANDHTNKFVAFGLTDIQWIMEVIEPDI